MQLGKRHTCIIQNTGIPLRELKRIEHQQPASYDNQASNYGTVSGFGTPNIQLTKRERSTKQKDPQSYYQDSFQTINPAPALDKAYQALRNGNKNYEVKKRYRLTDEQLRSLLARLRQDLGT